MVPQSPHWYPEDDLLLKNAIEDGASLESLAKGAVRFSRRYSLLELQQRWYSLLYDPSVSEGASALMSNVEYFSLMNPSKPVKIESTKEITCGSGKRRSETVRELYHAMRKRICSRPFDMTDGALFSNPRFFNVGDGNGLSSTNVRVGNSFPDGMDGIMDCSFPELKVCASDPAVNVDASSFHPFENQHQGLQIEKNELKNLSVPYREDHSAVVNYGQVPWSNESTELSPYRFFEGGDSHVQESAHPQLENESQILNCRIPYEVYASCIPTEMGGNQQHLGENFENPGTEAYLAEISDALFDFTDEDELLLMNTDEKGLLDKSYFDGLNSLLMHSPNNIELLNVGSVEIGATLDEYRVSSNDALCCEGVDLAPQKKEVAGQEGSSSFLMERLRPEFRNVVTLDEHHVISNHALSGEGVDLNSQNKEVAGHEGFSSFLMERLGTGCRNGVNHCVLNTEDTEVPDNDDVFLPFQLSPSSSPISCWSIDDPTSVVSSDIPSTRKTCGGASAMINDQHGFHVPYQQSYMSQKNSIGDSGMNLQFPTSNLERAAIKNGVSGEFEHGSDSLRFLQIDYLCKLEVQHHEEGCSNVEMNCSRPMLSTGNNESLLEDELPSECDFDVPYFSDIESMILDMDLCPDEFDLQTCPEVQKYQHEETKRTIIRLEQSSNACTKRFMALQGAFALLYSRRSRYFIKNPEVTVGRATEDCKVDVDLGQERDGGKISRRQAIIKMDKRGSFHLKNFGRSSIFVNGTEVEKGKDMSLSSGCLIQIRDLDLIFETNHKKVKQHLVTIKEEILS